MECEKSRFHPRYVTLAFAEPALTLVSWRERPGFQTPARPSTLTYSLAHKFTARLQSQSKQPKRSRNQRNKQTPELVSGTLSRRLFYLRILSPHGGLKFSLTDLTNFGGD